MLDAFHGGRVPADAHDAGVLRRRRPGAAPRRRAAGERRRRAAARRYARRAAWRPCARCCRPRCCIGDPAVLKGRRFGNVVLAASRAPLPVDELAPRLGPGAVPAPVRRGRARAFVGRAAPLTDADPMRSPAPPDETLAGRRLMPASTTSALPAARPRRVVRRGRRATTTATGPPTPPRWSTTCSHAPPRRRSTSGAAPARPRPAAGRARRARARRGDRPEDGRGRPRARPRGRGGALRGVGRPQGAASTWSRAQAWHWVDPVVGVPKAAAVLRPGGTLALFWNWTRSTRRSGPRCDEVYARVAPELDSRGRQRGNRRRLRSWPDWPRPGSPPVIREYASVADLPDGRLARAARHVQRSQPAGRATPRRAAGRARPAAVGEQVRLVLDTKVVTAARPG